MDLVELDVDRREATANNDRERVELSCPIT